MKNKHYAFIKANWHSEVVDQALKGFIEIVPKNTVDVFDVPGAFEIPLIAQKLAVSGKYSAIIAAALVVDGGVYRHDFVASAVVDGLMEVGLKTGIPILSVSLTPHNYHETEHHLNIYKKHFVEKGREAGEAAISITKLYEKYGST